MLRARVDDHVTLKDGTVVRLKDAVDTMIREVIVSLLNANDGPPKDAMLCLMNHMSANWRAMYILDQHAAESERDLLSHSLAILTRSMFDAYLQFAYIAKEDTQARALLYVNYREVERFQRAMKAVKQDDDIGKTVAASPLRPNGEKNLKARYDAVVSNYMNRKGEPRTKWYPQGNLGPIAEHVGKRDEYYWYVQRFNSSVHAGPLAAMTGNPGCDFLLYASVLMARVAQLAVQYHELHVSIDARSTMKAFAVASLTSMGQERDIRDTGAAGEITDP
ncbi:MAG: hypothetical protein JXQ75_03625 [Phycisphaerae bacterium]|nr:hypothetical protein [Phycisphaerae bacterium]